MPSDLYFFNEQVEQEDEEELERIEEESEQDDLELGLNNND